jgi:hypothetical protein
MMNLTSEPKSFGVMNYPANEKIEAFRAALHP